MITGVHAVVFSNEADRARAFLRDVLGFRSVDAGGGWLVAALPPAEIAVHPGTGTEHQLYLMCDDIDATMEELRGKGVEFTQEVSTQRWGRLTSMRLPGGGEIGLYQPTHPT